MLKLVKFQDPCLKLDFLTQFKPEDSCFIVSDIKNKIFLSGELLKKHSILPGACVLRPNDFYGTLFDSINTNWNIKSDSFVKAYLTDFLTRNKDKKIQHLARSKNFFECFNFCLLMLLDDERFSLFKEWHASQDKIPFPEYWLEISKNFFDDLKSKSILPESGMKAVLLDHLQNSDEMSFEKNKIVLDIGFSIDLCEKEIFTELSNNKDVYIISPSLKNNFLTEKNSFFVYKDWEQSLKKEDVLDFNKESYSALTQIFSQSDKKPMTEKTSFDALDSKKPTALKSKKFFQIESETQWVEVKKAISQVSYWIHHQGVSPNDIAIYAPNIEEYWLALKFYLEKESIPFRKTTYSRLIDFPDIKHILSALHLHLKIFSFSDLESFCFHPSFKNPKLKSFSWFKADYFKVPHQKKVFNLLSNYKLKDPEKTISGFEFIEWVLSFVDKDISSELSESLFKVLQKLSGNEELSFRSYLSLFELELFSEEIENEKEKEQGVSCLSFNAFHSVKSSYAFVLGLMESEFKKTSFLIESPPEQILSNILNSLGFSLPYKFTSEKENNLLWFLQSSHLKELYLSSYRYDWGGSIQTQSLIYILSNVLYSAKKTAITNCLTYESRQKESSSVADILKGQPQEKISHLERFFDLKKEMFLPIKKHSFSPSRIKTYSECPFKYAAEKIFYAKEGDILDQELSVLKKGSSIHKLFELTLKEHPDLELSEEQVEELIIKSLPDLSNFVNEKQEELTKDYLKRNLIKFLDQEKEQRKNMPSLKPVGFEAGLNTFWNQKEGQLSEKGEYVFKGEIDRIDYDETTKSYALRDYKRRGTKLTHISSWLNNEEFQLIFYAQALEKGLVSDFEPHKVSALFFSVYSEDFKFKGFVEKSSGLEELADKTARCKKERAELLKVIKGINQVTQGLVQKMEQGDFHPFPKDKNICETCDYKKWCRVDDV